jgi:hypothetical protein
VLKHCIFCGVQAPLTNAHVLAEPIRAAFNDPSVIESRVYRRSKQAEGSHAEHSNAGSWVDVKARVECESCNSGWTQQIEQSVSTILPRLIHGERMRITVEDQQALAAWSVVTVLLLQHTHSRAARVVIPARDYADTYQGKSPTALMKVFTGYVEPPGREGPVEASAEFLAEDRGMADVERVLASDGLPPPLDMHAYTATLRLGFWVAHVLRLGSPDFIERMSPEGFLGPCLATIWPAQDAITWPPRSLSSIGGLMSLARSIDNTGIRIGFA